MKKIVLALFLIVFTAFSLAGSSQTIEGAGFEDGLLTDTEVAGGNLGLEIIGVTVDRVWDHAQHQGSVNGLTSDEDYIYTASDDNTVRKIDRETGNTVWIYDEYGDDVEDVAVDDEDNVYIGGDGSDELHKIDSQGNQVWTNSDPGSIVDSIDVDGEGNLYSASRDQNVYKINGQGDTVWVYTGHSTFVRAVTVGSDGKVYSGSDEQVHRIDVGAAPSDGSEFNNRVWAYTEISSAMHDLDVDEEGYVYSVSQWDDVQKIDVGSAPSDGSEFNDRLWVFDTGGRPESVSVNGKDNVYVGDEWGDGVHKVDVGAAPSDGSTFTNKIWEYTGTGGDIVVTTDDYGNVYSGSSNYDLHKINVDVAPSNGGTFDDTVWEYVGHTNTVKTVAVDSEDNFYTGSFDGEVRKFDQEGNLLWRYNTGSVYSVEIDNSDDVYVARNNGLIDKIDLGQAPSDGSLFSADEWTYDADSGWSFRDVTVDSSGNVYGIIDDRIHKVDADTGEGDIFYTAHEDRIHEIETDSEGNVYSGDRVNEVHKIGVGDNTTTWIYDAGDDVYSIDIDSEDNIYVGTRDPSIGEGGKLDKIDISKAPNDGSVFSDRIWRHTSHDWVQSITIDDLDNIYTGSRRDNEVHRLDLSNSPTDGSTFEDTIWEDDFHIDTVEELATDSEGNIYSVSADDTASQIQQVDEYAVSGDAEYSFEESEPVRWDVLEVNVSLNGQSVDAVFETDTESQSFVLEDGLNALYLDEIGVSDEANLTLVFETQDDSTTPRVEKVEVFYNKKPEVPEELRPVNTTLDRDYAVLEAFVDHPVNESLDIWFSSGDTVLGHYENVDADTSLRHVWTDLESGVYEWDIEVGDGFNNVSLEDQCFRVEDDRSEVIGCAEDWEEGISEDTEINGNSIVLEESEGSFVSSGKFTSNVFDAGEKVYWDSVSIESVLNGQDVNVTVEFSDDESFSTVEESVEFDVQEDSESFDIGDRDYRYARTVVELETNDQSVTPEVEEIVLNHENKVDVEAEFSDIVNPGELVDLTGSITYLPLGQEVADNAIELFIDSERVQDIWEENIETEGDWNTGSLEGTIVQEDSLNIEAGFSGNYVSEQFSLQNRRPLKSVFNVSKDLEARQNVTAYVEVLDSSQTVVDYQRIDLDRGLNDEYLDIGSDEYYRFNLSLETENESLSPEVNDVKLNSVEEDTDSSGVIGELIQVPEDLGIAHLEVLSNYRGIDGSDTVSFDVRNLTFESTMVSEGGQEVNYLNPGESFGTEVEIDEFNGTDYFSVQDGSFDLQDELVNSLTHTENGLWETGTVFEANETLGENVFSFDIDGVSDNGIEGQETDSITYTVQNITIDADLQPSTVNSSETIDVSGTAESLPDQVDAEGEVDIWRDLGQGFEYVDSSTLVNGEFSLDLSTEVPGKHSLKVNMTDDNGITGYTSEEFTVLLDISNQSAEFKASGTNYLDVEEEDSTVNVSSNISESPYSSIDNVTLEIDTPEGPETLVDSTPEFSADREWYREIDVENELGSSELDMGEYNVTLSAMTENGVGSNQPLTQFYVQNVSLTQELDKEIVNPGEEFNVSGNAVRLPDQESLNTDLNASIGEEVFETEIVDGSYDLTVKAPEEVGSHTVNVEAITEEGVEGRNSTSFEVMDLTITIDTFPDQVFRRSDDTPEYSFEDVLTADNQNTGNLSGIDYEYNASEGFRFANTADFVSELSPGETHSSNPDVGVGPEAEIGQEEIILSAESSEGIAAEDNITIEVWSRAETEFTKAPEVIDQDEEFFSFEAEVLDYATEDLIEGHEVFYSAAGGDQTGTAYSDENGTAYLDINVQELDVGQSYTIFANAEDDPENQINETDSVSSHSFEVLGVIDIDQSSVDSPVYRNPQDGEQGTAFINFVVHDSAGDPVENVGVNFEIADHFEEDQTDVDGEVSFSYTPKTDLEPGEYDANFTFEKEDYETLEFSDTIEVRGILDIEQINEEEEFVVDESYLLEASLVDANNEAVDADINWTINDMEQATGESDTWTPTLEPGSYDLNVTANKQYFDNDFDNRSVEVFGEAKIAELKPGDSSIKPGTDIPVEAVVEDRYTGNPVEDMSVEFAVNGSIIHSEETDADGKASMTWTPEEGFYELSANIERQEDINYLPVEENVSSEVNIAKDMRLEEFSKQYSEVYRNPIGSPSETEFEVNISETAGSEDNVPAEGVNVTFEVNETDVVSCETGIDGVCSVIYEPSSSVSLGEVEIEISTDRDEWNDILEFSNINIIGFLSMSIESPENEIVRGEENLLKAEAVSEGDEVDVPANWSYRGQKVEEDLETQWDVPETLGLGAGELEVVVDTDEFERAAEDVEIPVYGRADVELESSNENEFSYTEKPAMVCSVHNKAGEGIEGYDVDLYVDSVFEGTQETDSSGEAVIEWDIPTEIGSFNVSCEISRDDEMYYLADQDTGQKTFEVIDDVEPEIQNINIQPEEPQLEDNATISFEAFDEIELDTVVAEVQNPVGETEQLNLESEGDNYTADYSTDDIEGTYQLIIDAVDTSGNDRTQVKSFDVEPRGSVELDQDQIDLDSITQQDGATFEINATFEADEEAENVTLEASSEDGEMDVNILDAQKSCSSYMNPGENCSESFDVEIEPGTEPKTTFLFFEAKWDSVEFEEESQVEQVASIDILENPVMSVENILDMIIPHGENEEIEIDIESKGNFRLEDYNAKFVEGNLTEEYVTIEDGSANNIQPGETHTTKVDISLENGTSPGFNTSDILFDAGNANEISRSLDVEIPQDVSFKVEPQQQEQGAVIGFEDEIADFRLISTGNLDTEIVSSVETGNGSSYVTDIDTGFVLQKQSEQNASVTVNSDTEGLFEADLLFETDEPLYDSDHDETVTLYMDVIKFETDIFTDEETLELEPGENTTVEYELTLGNDPVTQNFTVEPILRNQTMNLEKKSTNVWTEEIQEGVHETTFEIPEIPDARNYDLEIQITETEKKVTTSASLENKITVPDITPPEINEINIQDIEPGQNTTVQANITDNNLEGSQNAEIQIPDLNKTEQLEEESDSNWTKIIQVNETGEFIAEINAEDPAGNNATETTRFRVANKTEVTGSFTDASGNPQDAKKTFTDSFTGREVVSVETDEDGNYDFEALEGTYDVEIEYENIEAELKNAEIDVNTTDPIKMDELNSVAAPAPNAEQKVMGVGVENNMAVESANLTFSYSDYSGNMPSNLGDLQLARCNDYEYSTRSCGGDYEIIDVGTEDIDTVGETITVGVEGFSSYTLFVAEDETEEDDSDDSGDSPSSGGSGGGGVSEGDLSGIEEGISELQDVLFVNETSRVDFGADSINVEIEPGENQRISLEVENTDEERQEFEVNADSTVGQYMDTPRTVDLDPGESVEMLINVSAPPGETPGSYSGLITIESDTVEAHLPANIRILPPDDELLDMMVEPVFSTVQPGDALRVEMFVSNEGFARNVDVTVDIELMDPDNDEIISRTQETLAIGTTLTQVVELEVPEDIERKQYEIRGSTRYTNIDADMIATGISTVTIDIPFWERQVLGLTYMTLARSGFILLLISIIGYSGYAYRRQKIMEKKRYLEKIDLDTIPTGGRSQGFIGELAEMGTRTFFKLDDLTTHALVAGATGSGKTVTAQGMVEEALKNGVNVVVLDPTAQWTGFLRENKDSAMLQLFKDYGMSADDAKAFDGNIRAVEPEQEDVDITPYLESDESGNIIVFSLHKLDSDNIDEFVDSTIQQIFDANLEERNHLETLVVYDEVHRLLEKFGGSGKGLKQLERGAREFRKWGVGMVLVSQVISDFSGEIRANIGTTIQMRTQYDNDLDRLKNKFGMDTVKSVAKAEVGSGMLQSSDYNHGRPYFVDFRPLLHSPHRLSDDELDRYEEYNQRIDELEERIDGLEEKGQEVYEYRSELKLAKKNLKKGSFNLVDIYLDELEENLQ